MPNILEDVEQWVDSYVQSYLNKTKIDYGLRDQYVKMSDKYAIVRDGSNFLVYGNWEKNRREILNSLSSAIHTEIYPRFNIRYDRQHTSSSAGAIIIWNANEELPNRYKRLTIVLKPMSERFPLYKEAETTFCETMNNCLTKYYITNIEFEDKAGKRYGFSGPKIQECIHVGGNNKKPDVYFRTDATLHPSMKISLKLSSAEYVSKERKIIQAMIDYYYDLEYDYNGDLVITNKQSNKAIIVETCPITGRLLNPKRVYLHIPDNILLSHVLFGKDDDEVDCVLTLPENLYDIENSVYYNPVPSGQKTSSFTYNVESIIDKSDINKLQDIICVCLRNADSGRAGLQVGTERNPAILPTVIFTRGRPYSIPI